MLVEALGLMNGAMQQLKFMCLWGSTHKELIYFIYKSDWEMAHEH
jgi:hypothetical protein